MDGPLFRRVARSCPSRSPRLPAEEPAHCTASRLPRRATGDGRRRESGEDGEPLSLSVDQHLQERRNPRLDARRANLPRVRTLRPSSSHPQPIAAPAALATAGSASSTWITASNGWGSPYLAHALSPLRPALRTGLPRDSLITVAHPMWGSFWMAAGTVGFLTACGVLPAAELARHLSVICGWMIPLLTLTWTVAGVSVVSGVAGAHIPLGREREGQGPVPLASVPRDWVHLRRGRVVRIRGRRLHDSKYCHILLDDQCHRRGAAHRGEWCSANSLLSKSFLTHPDSTLETGTTNDLTSNVQTLVRVRTPLLPRAVCGCSPRAASSPRRRWVP